MGTRKYWEEDPTHSVEWGEKGGLPIDPRTIHTVITDGAFVSTDKDIVLFGGASTAIPKNQTEMQKWRENNQWPTQIINPVNIGYTPPNIWGTALWDVEEWG